MRSLLIVVAAIAVARAASADSGYQKPAKPILDVLHARLPPNAFVSPSHDAMILATRERYPPISDLARTMLRLGGVRIEPLSNNVHGAGYFRDFAITRFSDGKRTEVKLPAGARPGVPQISADGKRFAFGNQSPTGVELWIGDMSSGAAHRVGKLQLNPVLGEELRWMPDQRTLLVKLVPARRGAAPTAQAAPDGPRIAESSGAATASSTYETRDVLKSPHDALLFDYYAMSQLALVDAQTGSVKPLGAPGVYVSAAASPDGSALLVQRLHRPYSYVTTFDRFPRDVEIWDPRGKLVHGLANLPLFESVPIWGVPTGPRDFEWRANASATVVYAEALDGGDWNKPATQRDRVLVLSAPWQTPVELATIDERLERIDWAKSGGTALLTESDPIKHWRRTLIVDADKQGDTPRILWDRSSDERYKDPGMPVMHALANGYEVLAQIGDDIFTTGLGASTDGDRPFLDRWSLKTMHSERLFRSGKSGFEYPYTIVDAATLTFLTRAESPTDYPNFYVRTLGKGLADAAAGEGAFSSTARKITSFTDPTPQLRGITKRIVKYKRNDGVDLSFTLYLPPGYKEGTRLPTVVWAYPLDYADARVAGQVVGSPQRFTQIGWPLHLFFLLDGYAVIDNPSMPVVGDANKIYDKYLEQLVAGAKAAVDQAVALGVTDPERVGVTGHSHGGMMTVNLLAHTSLFRAGIARSGAYNKTLTGFGFQNERRSLWQARDVYMKVSPYFFADKIKSPLLIIHGDADYNPGTIPLQSEQLYQAIKGTGGQARLVMLPFESHGYAAMESTEHVLWEMLSWFDHYVKNAPPRGKESTQRQ